MSFQFVRDLDFDHYTYMKKQEPLLKSITLDGVEPEMRTIVE